MVAQPSSRRSHLALTPSLFVGIDVGKTAHVAGFVSASLLKQKRFEQCPTLVFEQSQAGIAKLLARIGEHVPINRAAVLVESTGHYHRALCEQLAANGITVYVVAVRSKRLLGISKTDRADALRLANSLYAQLALGLQLTERSQQIRQLVPATDAAQQLAGFVQRRYELVQSCTRAKNKLTAMCDELFPEFASVFKDPNAPVAMDIRFRWPTPALLAEATPDGLRVIKQRYRSLPEAKLEKIQQAARTSIGVTAAARVQALVFEQAQMIESLRFMQTQVDEIETRISTLVEGSREGQILMSLDCMGPIKAATLLATIGNIRNFPTKGALRKFCGCAPQDFQTGTSADRAKLNPTGKRPVKQTLFLLSISAINQDTVWQKIYERLVERKCAFDAKTKTHKGKMKVIGRIAGQMVGVIYSLLRADADLVDNWDGEELPSPQLYDRAIHTGTKQKHSPGA